MEATGPPAPARRLAALVPNIEAVAPGQRARIETWIPLLEERGWTVDLYPFEDARLHEVLYRPGRPAAKALRLLSCYLAQARRVLTMPEYDLVLIYREAALVGPAVLERLVARRSVPVVFDLDDPTFVPYRSPNNGWFSLLKFSKKTDHIFRLADHVIVVNQLVADYASRFNSAVTVVPNFIDVAQYRPVDRPADRPVTLVWTGSQSTTVNLLPIAPALARLQREHGVTVRIVCDVATEVPGVDVQFRPFSPETQVSLLQDCQVGLLPVADTSWNRWKSFFKVAQYMAVGLPVVARRIGNNADVIQDGVNGFLVESVDEWYDRLDLLIGDPCLRARMGVAARTTAVESFSVEVQMARVADILETVAAGIGSRRRPA